MRDLGICLGIQVLGWKLEICLGIEDLGWKLGICLGMQVLGCVRNMIRN